MKTHSIFHASDKLEIRNTGLRPNWDSFWALENTDCDTSRNHVHSFFSFKSAQSGGTLACVRHVKFVTGSEWIGEWDRTGMTGMGMYKMPHGVIYEGTMKAGHFEGIGFLKYPNGSSLEGLWHQGKLKYWQFVYADGLERDSHNWTYCFMPDRRFYSEHEYGFRPATAEQVSNNQPAREVPPGHYDVGQGFYNPKSHCVVDAITGEVLSVPTVSEEEWILKRCRSAEPLETVEFRPDLYENLFKESSQQPISVEIKREGYEDEEDIYGEVLSKVDSELSKVEHLQWSKGDLEHQPTEKEYSIMEKEILSVFQQEGAKLQPMKALGTSHRRISLHDKLEVQKTSLSSIEGLIKKIMKEIELSAQSTKMSDDLSKKQKKNSSEADLLRLNQIINAYAETTKKKTLSVASSMESSNPSNQFRILGKLLPSVSLTKVVLDSSLNRESRNILEVEQETEFT